MNEVAAEIAEIGANISLIYAHELTLEQMVEVYARALVSREQRNYQVTDFEEAITYAQAKHIEILGAERAKGPNQICETLIRLTSNLVMAGFKIDPE